MSEKHKNEFIIIDDEPRKRKQKPVPRYSVGLIIGIIVLILGSVAFGAGAVLLLTSPATPVLMPTVIATNLPPSTQSVFIGMLIPFSPTIPPVYTPSEGSWQLMVHAVGNFYSINSDSQEPVQVVAHAEDPLFSPDGARIAYQRDEDGTTRPYIALTNGSAEQLVGDSVMDKSYFWSPDGTMLAYFNSPLLNGIATPTADAVLYLADAETGEFRALLSENIDFSTVYRWSPDSRSIAFVGIDARLYIVDVQTGDVKRFVSMSVHSSLFQWSPDGAQIAYVDAFASTVYVATSAEMNTEPSHTYALQPFITALAWAKNGFSLAVAYGMETQRLQVMDLTDEAQAPQITALPDGTLRDGLFWADDNRIVFLLDTCDPRVSLVFVANIATSSVTEVADLGDSYTCSASSSGRSFWSLSPDGTHIAYTISGGLNDGALFLVDVNTGDSSVLMRNRELYAPVWHP